MTPPTPLPQIVPECPQCGSTMERKRVRKGPRAGLEMWSCARYPDCKGAINIDSPAGGAPSSRQPARPAEYAQARHEREIERSRLKRRAALPLLVGSGTIAIAIAFVALQGLGILVASAGSMVVGLALAIVFYRMPFDSLIWTKGVEGERKTAQYLAPLHDRGYIALYNRLVPGLSGDVDAIVIGPSGIYPIETKNWSRTVDIRNGRLFAGDSERSWAIDQLYRGAVAVQVALGEPLNTLRVTVTPILCAVGGTHSQGAVRGVYVTNGKTLSDFIDSRPRVLTDAQVQEIARVAEKNLRQQHAWEV